MDAGVENKVGGLDSFKPLESTAAIDSKKKAPAVGRFVSKSKQVISSRTPNYANKATTARQTSYHGKENLQQIDIHNSQHISTDPQFKVWCICRGKTMSDIELYCFDLPRDDDRAILPNFKQLHDLVDNYNYFHPDTGYMKQFGMEIKNMISPPTHITFDGSFVASGSRIYCAGGMIFDRLSPVDGLSVLDTCITPLRWRKAAKMHMLRVCPRTAVLDGKIYIVGSLPIRDHPAMKEEFDGYCEIFDTNTKKKIHMACLPRGFLIKFNSLELIGVDHHSRQILFFSPSPSMIVSYHVDRDYWRSRPAPDDLYQTQFLKFRFVLVGHTVYWLNSEAEACAYNLSNFTLCKSKAPLDFLQSWYHTLDWELAYLCHLTGDDFCLVFQHTVVVYCMKLHISYCIDDTRFLTVSLKSAVHYHATFPLTIFRTLLVAIEKTGNQEASTSTPTTLDY